MFIVDQERRKIVNTDKAVSIERYQGNKIIACETNRTGYIALGEYETPNRAIEVFDDLIQMLYALRIYYMPEK